MRAKMMESSSSRRYGKFVQAKCTDDSFILDKSFANSPAARLAQLRDKDVTKDQDWESLNMNRTLHDFIRNLP